MIKQLAELSMGNDKSTKRKGQATDNEEEKGIYHNKKRRIVAIKDATKNQPSKQMVSLLDEVANKA